jgi:hypothetical protein
MPIRAPAPYGRDATVCISCTKVLHFQNVPKRASSKIPQAGVLRAYPLACEIRSAGLFPL